MGRENLRAEARLNLEVCHERLQHVEKQDGNGDEVKDDSWAAPIHPPARNELHTSPRGGSFFPESPSSAFGDFNLNSELPLSLKVEPSTSDLLFCPSWDAKPIREYDRDGLEIGMGAEVRRGHHYQVSPRGSFDKTLSTAASTHTNMLSLPSSSSCLNTKEKDDELSTGPRRSSQVPEIHERKSSNTTDEWSMIARSFCIPPPAGLLGCRRQSGGGEGDDAVDSSAAPVVEQTSESKTPSDERYGDADDLMSPVATRSPRDGIGSDVDIPFPFPRTEGGGVQLRE